MKVSFGKTWAVFFSLNADALPKRSSVKTSSNNQQMLLPRMGGSDFEG
jgi:hypothetical protein